MKKYENIDVNKFTTNIFTQFKYQIQADNSVLLIRWKPEKQEEPTCKLVRQYYGGAKTFEITVQPERKEIEAIVIVMRTSTNHYAVIGSRREYTMTGYGKTVGEVSDFITRHFCHTLLDEAKGV